MKRTRFWSLIAVVSIALSGPAQAHSDLEGIGDFYGGLLHPLVVPAEALALVSLGLLVGLAGAANARAGLAALPAGLVAGLLLPASWPWPPTPALLVLALLAGAAVAGGLRLHQWLLAACTLLLGLAVGVDAQPEAETIGAAVSAGVGTVLSGTLIPVCIAGLVFGRTTFWQVVATRIAGSWIAAISMLYLAWLIAN